MNSPAHGGGVGYQAEAGPSGRHTSTSPENGRQRARVLQQPGFVPQVASTGSGGVLRGGKVQVREGLLFVEPLLAAELLLLLPQLRLGAGEFIQHNIRSLTERAQLLQQRRWASIGHFDANVVQLIS